MPVWLQIVLGVCAPLIAFLQWKLSRHKLKLDLFDRRWKIYAATNDMLATLINGSDEDRRERANDFRRQLMDARFLCSKNTIDFLDKVNEQIASVVDAERALRSVPQNSPGRKEAEMLVVKKIEECRAGYKALVSIFKKELRIDF